ncbi:MAG: hypothetical protein LJE91_12925 [Gammaproteobacteria bacterium]|nr:hypothetical protein [Gammaproteobacteria bacterium]
MKGLASGGKAQEGVLRLPICITADGLHPNQSFFEPCQHNDWRFIVTFKDGNLPTVWEGVRVLRAITPNAPRVERRIQGQSEITEQLSGLMRNDDDVGVGSPIELVGQGLDPEDGLLADHPAGRGLTAVQLPYLG